MADETLKKTEHGGEFHGEMAAHAHDHHDDHHHHGSFLTQYVFSTDHKVIAKQFLITGIFMAIIGIGMSSIF